MEENTIVINVKKEKIKLVVLVVSILMIATSVTYAFFVAGVSDPANTDANLGTEVSGGLVFTPGVPINLVANLTNFTEGNGSLSGETTSTANLKAASSTGSATENYYIYYNVTSNNFVYTVDNTTPELLLTITGPDGEITSLINHPELTHKTVNDAVVGNISGFDVTEFEGLILIDDSYTISTTDSTVGTTQEWKAKLTFVNLDTLQTANEGKRFESELILQASKFNYADITLANMGYSSARITEINSNPEPDFSQVATDNEGLFAAQDDYGTSYYYRGAVDNNWVEFAGYYWRIIRINGDGSIRMIYSGSTQPKADQSVVMTGAGTQISTRAFNTNYNSAEYTGYMYTVGQQHGLSTDSTIKTALDTWYEENILNTKYHNMISDTLFCGDRTAYLNDVETTIASGVGTTYQNFGSFIRNVRGKFPTFQCFVKADSYTVTDIEYGNSSLKYSVALISYDEVTFAGNDRYILNTNNYIYTNNNYWTISPYAGSSHSQNAIVAAAGTSDGSGLGNANGIRPVISLLSAALISGSGQWNDPYVVE